jgi:hypothetical protein
MAYKRFRDNPVEESPRRSQRKKLELYFKRKREEPVNGR